MSVLKIKDADGNEKYLIVSGTGTSAKPFHSVSEDFLIAIERGDVPGHDVIHKFGHNGAVPNGSYEFITDLGQTAHALSAATTVRIKAGGNAADDTAGAGAREITIQGIDDNLNEITETITTAGAAASAVTTALFWRVHRMWVSSVGTYGVANTAAITLENGTGGTDIIRIAATEGQTEDAIFTIPTGKTGYLLSAFITVDANQDADIKIYTRGDINDTTAPMKSKRLKKHFTGVSENVNYNPRSPNTVLPALTDIWVEAQGGGGSTAVSADLEILLIDD